MRTKLNISINRPTPEEAIEQLEWVVDRLKNYQHADRQGEFHYSYTYPVIVEEYEPYYDYPDSD